MVGKQLSYWEGNFFSDYVKTSGGKSNLLFQQWTIGPFRFGLTSLDSLLW